MIQMTSADSAAVAFVAALARPDRQPEAAGAALHAWTDALVGAHLFTILAIDNATRTARRVYTSDDGLYPSGATDALGDSIWERTLIGEKRPLILNDAEALASLLPEAPTLIARGWGAMLNLPVVVAGDVLGTINILHESGRYTADRVEAAQILAPAAATILLWEARRRT